ncbi:DUF1801 domain-containing protein [Kiritimatiellaeota bacterium B1221]|nr:DUF1801 domain-containing protein [Kiritimatiellaeota bacterium B1221]
MMSKEVDAYLAGIPELRRQRLQAFRCAVHINLPGVKETMTYKMPGFEREGRWVAMANQKQYLAIYFCSAELVEPVRKAHPELSIGVGCVRVKDRQAFPVDLLISCAAQALGLT